MRLTRLLGEAAGRDRHDQAAAVDGQDRALVAGGREAVDLVEQVLVDVGGGEGRGHHVGGPRERDLLLGAPLLALEQLGALGREAARLGQGAARGRHVGEDVNPAHERPRGVVHRRRGVLDGPPVHRLGVVERHARGVVEDRQHALARTRPGW